MASTAAARRPSFEKKRSTSALNLIANDEEGHGAGHGRQHKKFVAHASRHHSRVPSYGRNLNKLSKLAAAHDGTTKGHHLERGGSNGRKKAADTDNTATHADENRRNTAPRKATFEIGDSDEDTANEEVEEAPAQVAPVVKKSNGLKKSSSTKSLEKHPTSSRRELVTSKGEASGAASRLVSQPPPPQEQQELALRPERRIVVQEPVESKTVQSEASSEKAAVTLQLRRNNPGPSENILVEGDKKMDVLGETFVEGGRNARLFGQAANPAAVPPQVNVDYAAGMHTAVTNPAASSVFSNNQALTSRFIDSPGRSGASASVSPGYSNSDTLATLRRFSSTKSEPQSPSSKPKTTLSGAGSSTTSIPSRTQQKLWLQRQFDEDAQTEANKKNSQSNTWVGISQKEVERTAREFYNVRRFRDPVGEALERIRDSPKMKGRIPRKGNSSAAQEVGMGLSQSLNATTAKGSRHQDKGLKGSRDDSGLNNSTPQRDQSVQTLLSQLWNQPLLASNE